MYLKVALNFGVNIAGIAATEEELYVYIPEDYNEEERDELLFHLLEEFFEDCTTGVNMSQDEYEFAWEFTTFDYEEVSKEEALAAMINYN